MLKFLSNHKLATASLSFLLFAFLYINYPNDEPITAPEILFVKGGIFLMGSKEGIYPNDGEDPVRAVRVSDFWMDKTEVTNFMFSEFIKETGYVTEAEQFGWSFVVEYFLSPAELERSENVVSAAPWWSQVNGAFWNTPEGKDSSIEGRENHPVVHVSWNDAKQFCKWRGMRLPTEAEWEYAARGGLEQKLFPWGDERMPNNVHMANVFQGEFPHNNTRLDGYAGSSPVKSFPPNNFGFYDLSGNVWEWTEDWFTGNHQKGTVEKPIVNPKGPKNGVKKVCKGGSFMCHRSYCYRWRCSARTQNTPDTTTHNIGFRCAKSEKN